MIWALRSRCLRPFDHQKYTVVLRPFSVMLRPLLLTFFTFCYFLLLFLLLVTFWNYFLLLKVQCLLLFLLLVTFINCFFYCWKRPGESFTYIFSLFRGRGCSLIFYFCLLLRGRGKEVGFFFVSFEMWKEEGKGVIFTLKLFFSLWNGWGRERFFFFYKFIMGGGVGWKWLFPKY